MSKLYTALLIVILHYLRVLQIGLLLNLACKCVMIEWSHYTQHEV